MTVSVETAGQAEEEVTYKVLEGEDPGRVTVEVTSDNGSFIYVVSSRPFSV